MMLMHIVTVRVGVITFKSNYSYFLLITFPESNLLQLYKLNKQLCILLFKPATGQHAWFLEIALFEKFVCVCPKNINNKHVLTG